MILTDGVPTATATVLRNAAFGDDPGRWPLPAAGSPDELWLRAVVAGGQGRYAGAYADLARVRRAHRVGRLASLAHSTQASFLRQLGWHDRARGWDGRALAVADTDLEGHMKPPRQLPPPWTRSALPASTPMTCGASSALWKCGRAPGNP